MVQLRDLYHIKSVQDLLCFNSNMVQLRAEQEDGTPATTEFQFQYGSIKSIFMFDVESTSLLFQFQYGSIKRF